MNKKFRVKCSHHRYDTLFTLDTLGGAITAARMHALLPCDKVEITDTKNQIIDWRTAKEGPQL
jgi:hypothetical protein